MTHISVTCPSCNHLFVINGRGKCRCGTYLVHHVKKGFVVRDDTDYYMFENGAWRLLRARRNNV